MPDSPDTDQELTPKDELLRMLGTQDDPADFVASLHFIDDIATTLMSEFSRRFPADFSAWCQRNEMDEVAMRGIIAAEDD